MKIATLQDLYIDLLKDILWAERKITTTLPKMAEAAVNPKVKAGFEKHLEETKGQIERLEQVFESLGEPAEPKKCEAMDGLAKEGEEIMEACEASVMDAGLIVAAQKVEHYEIGSYGTLVEYARLLGFTDQQKLLQATLDEEKACDKQLTIAAESIANEMALTGKQAA